MDSWGACKRSEFVEGSAAEHSIVAYRVLDSGSPVKVSSVIGLVRRVRLFKRVARRLVMRGACLAVLDRRLVRGPASALQSGVGGGRVRRGWCAHGAVVWFQGSEDGTTVEDLGSYLSEPVEHIAR